MKILVTGSTGQLGTDVMKELRRRGLEAAGVSHGELDLTDSEAVAAAFRRLAPDAVIHCAAWTAVDAAEDPASLDQVRRINAGATETLARLCREQGSRLLYVSTDYVFDGSGTVPWKPEDARCPLNVYGQTKYEGELAVQRLLDRYFIVRTAWVFGPAGSNFFRTMLRLGRTRKQLTVVNDQIGTPTYTPDLAVLLAEMIQSDRFGVYHAANQGGWVSWYDIACEIFRQAADYDPCYRDVEVLPTDSASYAAPARRPHNSRLDQSKLAAEGFAPLPDWHDALHRFLEAVRDEI